MLPPLAVGSDTEGAEMSGLTSGSSFITLLAKAVALTEASSSSFVISGLTSSAASGSSFFPSSARDPSTFTQPPPGMKTLSLPFVFGFISILPVQPSFCNPDPSVGCTCCQACIEGSCLTSSSSTFIFLSPKSVSSFFLTFNPLSDEGSQSSS